MTSEQDNLEKSDSPLLHSLTLTNVLSFGIGPETTLNALNLLIGPNGSGKSNLIDVIDLLRNTPKDLMLPIRQGGGVQDWLWKGEKKSTQSAIVNAVVTRSVGLGSLRHTFSFTAIDQRFELSVESIEDVKELGDSTGEMYYKLTNGDSFLKPAGSEKRKEINHKFPNPSQSILSQLRDPYQYPEITHIAQSLEKIRIYRDWTFGRKNPARLPQKTDLPNDYLSEDASNLGLILNSFKRVPKVKKRLLEALRELYDGIDDYDVSIEGGTVQVFLQEGNTTIPATRLSDGTLRYLCLLAILCHPNPPPLVCIEEPELGLHPDIMPALAQLLKEASTRSQLIVTTHSDELVDAMTDQPESVLVCERNEQGTTLTRLNGNTLKPWLAKYRLGELWTRGEIGGTRW